MLSDPQEGNAYSYGRDNPLVVRDPSGKFALVDDGADFVVGGLIGGVVYSVPALYNGDFRWSAAGQSALTGGVIAWGVENAPISFGASLEVSSILTAAIWGGTAYGVGNALQQGIDVDEHNQSGFDLKEFGSQTLVGLAGAGFTEGLIPDAEIPGLSSGRDNWDAIGEGLETKLSNSTINNMSISSALKGAIGSQSANAYRTLGESLVDHESNALLSGNSTPQYYSDNTTIR